MDVLMLVHMDDGRCYVTLWKPSEEQIQDRVEENAYFAEYDIPVRWFRVEGKN